MKSIEYIAGAFAFFCFSTEAMQENQKKRTLVPIYRDTIFFKYHTSPCVILEGASTTGKSTLVSQMQDLRSEFVFTSFDELLCASKQGNVYDRLNSIINYFYRRVFFPATKQHKGIVIDTISAPLFIQLLQARMIKCPIYVFSLFISPKELADRLIKRNLKFLSCPENGYRAFVPFHQYFDIFKTTSTVTKIVLRYDDVLAACVFDKLENLASQIKGELDITAMAITQCNTKFQKPYVEKLLRYFDNSDSVFLTPRINYAYPVNLQTDKNFPDRIKDWLKNF